VLVTLSLFALFVSAEEELVVDDQLVADSLAEQQGHVRKRRDAIVPFLFASKVVGLTALKLLLLKQLKQQHRRPGWGWAPPRQHHGWAPPSHGWSSGGSSGGHGGWHSGSGGY